jgi:transcriptional regulator with XRE-family HTH domain
LRHPQAWLKLDDGSNLSGDTVGVKNAEIVGQRLREAREARDLTLEEAERATRIRLKFLDSLEQGDHAGMTPVQVQGFLRNYARMLGLDYDLLLEELEGDGKSRRRKQPPKPVVVPSIPRGKINRGGNFLRSIAILIVGGALIMLLIVGGAQLFKYQRDQSNKDNPEPTAPSAALGTESVDTTVTLPVETIQPAENLTGTEAAEIPAVVPGTTVSLQVDVIHRAIIRIIADGEIKFNGPAEAGTRLVFSGTQNMNIWTPDGGAVSLTLNGLSYGSPTARGELYEGVFTVDGAPTPTPMPSVTPSSTSMNIPAETASPDSATLFFTPIPTFDGIPSGDIESGMGLLPTSTLPAPTPTSTDTPEEPLTTTVEPSATTTADSSSTPTIPPPPITLSVTPSPTTTPTLTATVTASSTRTPTATFTPSLTPTQTPTMSLTPSITPTATAFLPPRITRTPSPPPK